jgi:hypothetical protein
MQCEISLPEVTVSSSGKGLTERQLQLLNLEGGLFEPKKWLIRDTQKLRSGPWVRKACKTRVASE